MVTAGRGSTFWGFRFLGLTSAVCIPMTSTLGDRSRCGKALVGSDVQNEAISVLAYHELVLPTDGWVVGLPCRMREWLVPYSEI